MGVTAGAMSNYSAKEKATMSKTRASRRDFLKATGAATAAIAIDGNATITNAKEKAVSARNPIVAHHEWGKLKEVIVGYPYFYFPREVPDYIANFLPETSVERY